MIEIVRTSSQRFVPSSSQVLVDEMLDSGDARDIVFALLDASTNQQKLRNLRSQIHTESPDRAAMHSIDRLTSARSDAKDLLKKAGTSGLRVRVRATIEFELEADSASGA